MDQIDMASSLEEQFRNLSLHQARKMLYGSMEKSAPQTEGVVYCVDCDKEIPKRRLEVVPHAKRCIQCQAEQES